MLRRIAVPVLLATGLVSAYLCWQSLTVAEAKPEDHQLAAAVLSPRRLPGLMAEASQDASLRASIYRLQAGRSLTGPAQACLVIRRDNRVVLATNADKPLIPASTHKVLTASAALDVIGPDSRFRTEVRRNRPVSNGVLDGALYVVGGGDPLLATPEFIATLPSPPAEFSSVDALAQHVAQAGIRRITGGLVADDDRFDDERLVSSWEDGYRSQGQVGGIGALVVNDGFGPPPTGRGASNDPALDAITALRAALVRNGIAVEGGNFRGNTPSGSDAVAALDSPRLGVIVGHMLNASDNTVAEVLLKNVAVEEEKEGDTALGSGEVVESLKDSGLPVDGLTVVEGSGLSRDNRATCRIVESTLRHHGSTGPVAAGLAKAGQTGTLEQRMVGTAAVNQVRAKTGSLAGVTALAGWATTVSGDISFATISNNVDPGRSRSYEDQLAVLLATAPAPPPVETFAPDPEGTR